MIFSIVYRLSLHNQVKEIVLKLRFFWVRVSKSDNDWVLSSISKFRLESDKSAVVKSEEVRLLDDRGRYCVIIVFIVGTGEVVIKS